jgi:hypothetical protein
MGKLKLNLDIDAIPLAVGRLTEALLRPKEKKANQKEERELIHEMVKHVDKQKEYI